MTAFDPERFEAEKYREYFTELQEAYKASFERMRGDLDYDSTLVHAVDQFVLNESEPVWNADTDSFEIDVPTEPSPSERVASAGVAAEEAHIQSMMQDYRAVLSAELRSRFGLPPADEEPGSTDEAND